ncbi:GNAT family N-acetyltransferase [Pigmentiphaga litoralis]|uniref:GNAT superfamily N-acetyltransferase n=1 Tax=Pigmentiphaga litoralis TaxID=516702 RepID=A0A7Y9IR81_9BURK|nr:GNAT family protein [Pigmentiphaga litoralis]NYE24899.1 GNAT superfamily N-acetyltransferase [Pigmentiphaga litoralis]NYE81487.1 GNAT superfamily N-acetyltransferase [Pigmentiphaga litoralis]
MIAIQKFDVDDWSAVWAIIAPVIRAGETFAYSPEISEAEARKLWVDQPVATYVAKNDRGDVLGTYYLTANQPGLGSHVASCAYIVSDRAKGQGVASLMCEHSQQMSMRLGFRAMQFNMVVATNLAAVQLWQRLGFEIIGTLPDAFRHASLGFVDAHIMYKRLGAPADDRMVMNSSHTMSPWASLPAPSGMRRARRVAVPCTARAVVTSGHSHSSNQRRHRSDSMAPQAAGMRRRRARDPYP